MEKQKNLNMDYIPNISEMQDKYKEELRIKALKITRNEDKVVSKNHSFFQEFRKFEKQDTVTLSNIEDNNIYYKKYKEYLEDEIKQQGKKIEEVENLINYHKFFLNWERKINREIKGGSHYGSNSATRYRVDRIKELEQELDAILQGSHEAKEFYYKRQLTNDIKTQSKQGLVESSYVMASKQKVIDSLGLGVPVYIVGHLGSGKTQLATEAAIDFTIQNKIQDELENKMHTWLSKNPASIENDAIMAFKRFNRELKEYYKNLLETGSKEEIEALHPLFISGSYNLTYEDMFVEKTLSLEQGTEMGAFGTVIKKIDKEILIAVKEGRIVIVDELNTIAMQNLIALNDILQRNWGSTAYITGVGPVVIKRGFGFIGTGNLSTQMVNYEGTNELNPAFKSRFVTIEYNYVPQNIIGALEEQEEPEKNELFRIIVARLSDKNGNIHMPNAKRSMEELFRFSQLCKVTQNVFMGKLDESELELRESVLSIRNIFHVLDSWNLGEEKDLSKALWDGFISSITYPDDQNYILSQAVRFGFFPSSDGWVIKSKGIGEVGTTYDDIRTRPYNYVRQSVETLSYLEVSELIYEKEIMGKTLPKELEELFKVDLNGQSYIDVEKYKSLDKRLSHLEHSKDILEYLEDNIGEI